ncbi:hypothetical protein RI367_006279 [Sorochytrium milnesiophthora]
MADEYVPLARPAALRATDLPPPPLPPRARPQQHSANKKSRKRAKPERPTAQPPQEKKRKENFGFNAHADEWDDTALIRAWDAAKGAFEAYKRGEMTEAELEDYLQQDDEPDEVEEAAEPEVSQHAPAGLQEAFDQACMAWYWSGYYTGVYNTMLQQHLPSQQPEDAEDVDQEDGADS